MNHPAGTRRGRSTLQVLLRTGTHCTQSGWWSPVERGSAQFITEGSMMPAVNGEAVLWGRGEAGACGASCASCPCAAT